MILLQLFFHFLKIGLFSVGGGLATIPFLYELSAKTGWFSAQQLADMLAVAQSLPGPVGVNLAAYIGYLVGGIAGCAVSIFSLVIFSIIIIIIIAKLLKNFENNRSIKNAFTGLRPASVGLLLAAAVVLIRSTLMISTSAFAVSSGFFNLFKWKECILAVIGFLIVRRFKKIPPVIFLAMGAIIGIVFKL